MTTAIGFENGVRANGGPSKAAPLAGSETYRDEDERKTSIMDEPLKIDPTAEPLLEKENAVPKNENSVMQRQKSDRSGVADDEEKQYGSEDDDDDEILNLPLKLAATSPNKKPLLDDAQDHVASLVPVPPDGGWGWVIVFASFMANLVVDGIAYSFGIFMPEFQAAFEGTEASVAVVGSMLCGVYLLVGPIVSGLVNMFGGRSVMIAGSILGTLAFFASYFSPSIGLLMLFYGIVGGVGFGLIYLPAIVYVGYYFEKKRALATGIAVAGSGFGTFVFAPLSVALIEQFSWRGSLWILAGLVLNCAVFGALMRPLPPPKAAEDFNLKKEELHKAISQYSGLQASDWTLSQYQQERIRRSTLQTQGSHVSGGFQSPTFGEGTDRSTVVSRARSNLSESSEAGLPVSPSMQPALEQVQEEPEPVEQSIGDDSEEGANGKRKPNGSTAHTEKQTSEQSDVKSSATTPSPVPIEGPARKPEAFQKPRERGSSIRSSSPVPSSIMDGGNNPTAQVAPSYGSPSMNEIRPQLSRMVSRTSRLSVHNYAVSMQRLTSAAPGSGALSARSYQSLASVDPTDFARPFARQDILYPGSIHKLAEYKKSQSNINKYRESTISIPQMVEIYEDPADRLPVLNLPPVEEVPAALSWIPAGVRHTLMAMVDYKLLKSPAMVLLCVSNTFGMLGFYVPFVYLTNYAESLHFTKSQSSYLLSVIGITNTLGRIIFGAVCDKGWVKALTINNVCLLICGVLTLMVPWFTTYALLMLYSVIFGFFISAYISLTAIILVDYMGLQNLTNSFGLVILFRGLSSMAGSPLAGAVKHATNSYSASFWFAGSLILIGGLISCFIPFVDAWYKKRYGVLPEVNGKPMSLADDRFDELDEIMAELAEQEDSSRAPSAIPTATVSASQTLTPV